MEAAAREWRRSNEEAEAVIRRTDPSHVTTVRYEDLCENPEHVLRRLFTFIGANPDVLRLDFRQAEHHVVGNGMRLDSTSEIRVDERWRQALGPTELEIFAGIAGPLNRRLGYA